MNSNHPLRALIRSIITEAPLDDYYSVAPPTGPRTQGHVPPEQIPALRKLFDRMGHTYSIQVATNPLRSWEALKPLIKNKTLKKLNSKKSGVWIIPSHPIPSSPIQTCADTSQKNIPHSAISSRATSPITYTYSLIVPLKHQTSTVRAGSSTTS